MSRFLRRVAVGAAYHSRRHSGSGRARAFGGRVDGRAWALLVTLALVGAAMSAPARGEVVAVDPLGAAVPVLWDGGVAWEDMQGVRAAAPGSPTRRLVSYRALGFTYSYGLDAGIGSGDSGGALAYGWEEANDMTPPMGPGDMNVPPPPLPYESSISHRGLIAADGHATQLPDCSTQDQPPFFGSYLVSLANATVAYLCMGAPPGMQVPVHAISPSYLALSGLAAPASPAQTIAEATAPFQASGDYVAYGAGATAATRRIVVARRDTLAVSYEVLQSNAIIRALALQADGTLVLLGTGTSACPKPSRIDAGQSFPAEWLSPADATTPHQLGCFYDGALRPVGGQWVALAPGPGTHASLELVTLATGATRTLAVFPNAGMAEPQLQQIPTQPRTEPSADFDGQRLAWVQQTCVGAAVQLTPDVAAMSPGPLPSARCPIALHTHGTLHPTARGLVRVRMSCPLGCSVVGTLIAGPRILLRKGPAYFSLPASSRPTTESFHLTRRQLAYLRRRRHVRVTISAETLGLGSGPFSRASVHVTLAR